MCRICEFQRERLLAVFSHKQYVCKWRDVVKDRKHEIKRCLLLAEDLCGSILKALTVGEKTSTVDAKTF